MREIKQLVIHHSVTDPNNKDIWAVSVSGHDYVPGLIIDGVEYKGNYGYLIYQDGEIKHPVPDERYTYNCGVYSINLTSIAICFVGNFEENEPSEISLLSAKQLIEELKSKYNIEEIYLHRDLYSTACPGRNINLTKIMEAKMKLSYEQVRRGYLAILRREPDGGVKNNYVGANMSEADFLCELGNSNEHTLTYDRAQLYVNGGAMKYEEITEKLYRKK